MKHVAIVVDWFGPYTSVKDAACAARKDDTASLYLVVGKVKHQKGKRINSRINREQDRPNLLCFAFGSIEHQ
jgi:hypothetical protein